MAARTHPAPLERGPPRIRTPATTPPAARSPRPGAPRAPTPALPQKTSAAFETDAQLSADGAPVVIHCEALERTTSGAGRVAGATLQQLSALDAGSWFGAAFAGARARRMRG